MFDNPKKKYRCFIVNEATRDKVDESIRDNIEIGDQYCQIETTEGEIVAASGGGVDTKSGRYIERAFFGTDKDIELARKHTIRKLNSLKPRSGIF